MRPLVAVSTSIVADAGPYQRLEIALYAVYLQVLEAAGLASVLLTPAHTAGSLAALLDRCSGLVLTGGEDVDPALYGETPHPALGVVNHVRDTAEMEALRLAVERRLPILAICRGCQLMNVFFGGTLYQDLPSQKPESMVHRQTEPWGRRVHEARVAPDSLLGRTVESDYLFINSFHHQGIKELAPGFRVSALADDGTIEAVEYPDYPNWLLGVQWHPERHEAAAPDSDPDRRLFHAFRQAVTIQHRNRQI